MITFQLDFDGTEQERFLASQIERKIGERLMNAGLMDLKVTFRRKGSDYIYELSGPAGDIAKARQVLEEDPSDPEARLN
jgi:hypothetical protein